MKKGLLPEVKKALSELKQDLSQIYGDRLRGIYLFGSYARGDFDIDSDVDVLIVLANFKSYGEELRRTSEMVGNVSLRYNTTVSVVFTRESEWQMDKLPLLMKILCF